MIARIIMKIADDMMITNTKQTVLVLNASWQAIDCVSTETAMCSLYAREYQAVDIDYDIEGNVTKMDPLKWDQWLDVTPRSSDKVIRTPFLTIRIPTVIITKKYNKVTFKKRILSLEAIRERDNNICQYTGRKLSKHEGSVDHIVAKSKGGKDSWNNLVYCDKKINIKKGSKSLKECGLKLLRTPAEPLPVLTSMLIKPSHKDWSLFLTT